VVGRARKERRVQPRMNADSDLFHSRVFKSGRVNLYLVICFARSKPGSIQKVLRAQKRRAGPPFLLDRKHFSRDPAGSVPRVDHQNPQAVSHSLRFWIQTFLHDGSPLQAARQFL
jgi:hypothetical protein